MTISLGRAAFEAYSATTNNLTYDGKKIPDWEQLGDTVRQAWENAADAVNKMPNSEYGKFFDQREWGIIMICQYYQDHEVGLPGHALMLLVNKLSRFLIGEATERPEPF